MPGSGITGYVACPIQCLKEKENYPKVEMILFGIMLILCIIGLFSVEAVFDAGMGI